MDIPAITAIPEDFSLTLKHLLLHDILKKLPVPLLMSLFSNRHCLECSRDLPEPLFLGCLGECRVKFTPFFMFTIGCFTEVVFCCHRLAGRVGGCDLEHSAFKEAEESLCMSLFLQCRFEENCRNLFISFFLCHFGGKLIPVFCL